MMLAVSKIRGAFAKAGITLSDEDIEEFGRKYNIEFEQPVSMK